MSKKALIDLTTEGLSKILEEFGCSKTIFQSEAQFQFDLAWALREKFNCKVKLEELTAVLTMENDTNVNEKKDSKTKTKIKKIYTDIVLEKDDYRVAIELKYKTSTLQNAQKALFLLNHGAVDLGRYDYLWDVNILNITVLQSSLYSGSLIGELFFYVNDSTKIL